uniref:SH3 domain-containing protein n=1 Tax=Acrobeloides nanus TaxID=290746 RepID=A0A914CP88_9BILA
MVVAKVVHLSKKNLPTIKLTEIKQLSKLLNELEMVRKLDRKEECIEIYGLCIDPRKAYLCMEVMDLSLADLKDVMVELENFFDCSYEDRPSFAELMETTFYKRGMSTEWINDVHKLIDWKNKLLEILNKDNLEKIYAIIHQPYFPQEENEMDNNKSAIFNVGDVVKLKEIGADGWLLGQVI